MKGQNLATKEPSFGWNTSQNLTHSTPHCTFPARAASIGNCSAIVVGLTVVIIIIAGFVYVWSEQISVHQPRMLLSRSVWSRKEVYHKFMSDEWTLQYSTSYKTQNLTRSTPCCAFRSKESFHQQTVVEFTAKTRIQLVKDLTEFIYQKCILAVPQRNIGWISSQCSCNRFLLCCCCNKHPHTSQCS